MKRAIQLTTPQERDEERIQHGLDGFDEVLPGYAAQAAAEVLVSNWRAALRDGSTLDQFLHDVADTIRELQQFEARLRAQQETAT